MKIYTNLFFIESNKLIILVKNDIHNHYIKALITKYTRPSDASTISQNPCIVYI